MLAAGPPEEKVATVSASAEKSARPQTLREQGPSAAADPLNLMGRWQALQDGCPSGSPRWESWDKAMSKPGAAPTHGAGEYKLTVLDAGPGTLLGMDSYVTARHFREGL